MDPLAIVEAQLGSVVSWPPYVLTFMFNLEPNPRAMRKVAAFMYGNNVRLSDAVGCYKACNVRHQQCRNRVEGVVPRVGYGSESETNGTVLQYAIEMSCLYKREGS